MATENSISQDLYDLLVTRDFDPEITDAQGQATQPAEGRIFTFDWVSSQGRNYGTAVIVLSDDNELSLFFGDNLGRTMDDARDKDEWFEFMQQLSQFATRHNFNTFAPKNIGQLKHAMAGMAAIKEGLFESYYGTRKISYRGEPTEARLVIHHNRTLDATDARHRNIGKLFIETQEGERFLLPFRNLTGGRAMLEHVRQGGRPYDPRGAHITEMISELKVLSRFHRASLGRVLEGVGQQVVEQAAAYYQQLRDDMARMATARGYQKYFESWSPALITDAEALVEDLKILFVEQSIDQRIEQALPLLAKIQRQQPMKEAAIFEQWADQVMEGTWNLPETPEQLDKLKTLMGSELIVGPDAINATEQLYDLVGDDQLFDRLTELASRDPRANAWNDTEVMERLKELGIPVSDVKPGSTPTPPDTAAAAPATAAPAPAPPAAAMQEGDNLATFEQSKCNHTMEGESCPVHGLAECGMHESLRDGEHHVAQVTFDDGTVEKVRITTDEGFRERIQQHFAKKGRKVTDIDVDYAVRADEDSRDPMDRRGGVWDSFYESQQQSAVQDPLVRLKDLAFAKTR